MTDRRPADRNVGAVPLRVSPKDKVAKSAAKGFKPIAEQIDDFRKSTSRPQRAT